MDDWVNMAAMFESETPATPELSSPKLAATQSIGSLSSLSYAIPYKYNGPRRIRTCHKMRKTGSFGPRKLADWESCSTCWTPAITARSMSSGGTRWE